MNPSVVLLVEDDLLIRMNTADELESSGFQVLEAENADVALQILEARPDTGVLFTDVDMPGSMNGVSLAAQVHQRWPHILILISSGHHFLRNDDVPDDGRFVSKPYSISTVVQHISDMAKSSYEH
ncbi:response regulator [Microvirga sp. P5_D2]